jgi:tetratricopeptide (TPR) repeat protein
VEGESPFVRQIYTLIHAGGAQAALKQLAQYHEKHLSKGDVEYLIPYGALLITEGESPSRGKKFLEQVLAGPSTPQMKSRAHHWLGYLLLSQEQGDMGEGHFLEALQLNPKDAAARFNLGRAYLKQEKYPQAFDYFALAELEMPELWLVHIYKGRAKAAIQHSDEAQLSFRAAVKASPDRWLSYIYYSFFQRGMHDTDGAQATLRKMLTRDPHFEVQCPAPWGFYQEKVNYAEYLAAFTAVMEKAAGEERVLGRLYLGALLNGPNSADAKKLEMAGATGGLLAKMLSLKASLDRDASLEDIKVAVARLPSNLSELGPYAYVLRGVGKERLGTYPDAKADFEQALQLEPLSAIARFELATLLRRTQHSGDADSEIKNLLLYHPGYIPAIVPSQNF